MIYKPSSGAKIKINAANPEKGLAARVFGIPDWSRTNGLSLRRRPLYPTELPGRIQKLFSFPPLQETNELPLRRGLLYPFNYAGVYLIVAPRICAARNSIAQILRNCKRFSEMFSPFCSKGGNCPLFAAEITCSALRYRISVRIRAVLIGLTFLFCSSGSFPCDLSIVSAKVANVFKSAGVRHFRNRKSALA